MMGRKDDERLLAVIDAIYCSDMTPGAIRERFVTQFGISEQMGAAS